MKVYLDASLPQDYLKTDIMEIVQSLRVSKWWKLKLVPELMTLTKITGAMTNAIYRVDYSGLPSLLLRVYGPNNGSIIDREYELHVLVRLSLKNIGPSLYGCFENGRVEQFLENATTLNKDDIRDWRTSQRIARRMKELHHGVPLIRQEYTQGPISWSNIEKWISWIEEKHSWWVSQDSKIQATLLCKDWNTFKKYVALYKNWLFDQENGFENLQKKLVFCHNDAQYGNLLFSSPVEKGVDTSNSNNILDTKNRPLTSSSSGYSISSHKLNTSSSSLFPTDSQIKLDQIINPSKEEQSQDSKLVVIDFEYAGANPAAFDLANHFSEWMYDYSGPTPHICFKDRFPTKEQSLNFIYSYVSHLRGTYSQMAIDDEVRYYYNSILRWRGAVHLMWSIWGIMQSGKLEAPEEKSTKREIIESLPSGTKYIIRTEEESSTDSICPVDASNDISVVEGVDIDSFNYLEFSKYKVAIFWDDMVKLKLLNPGDVNMLDDKTLSLEFL